MCGGLKPPHTASVPPLGRIDDVLVPPSMPLKGEELECDPVSFLARNLGDGTRETQPSGANASHEE